MKRVYKYGTGHPIPEGAVYLSTQVETRTTNRILADGEMKGVIESSKTENELVWHYFLVEVEE